MNKQDLKERVGKADQRVEVILKAGDTFWTLAEHKYDGQHPIDAIYEANGLTPTVEGKDDAEKMSDPVYLAGRTYVLPADSEIAELRARFWQRVDARTIKERVGDAAKTTSVTIRWDETIWSLADAKYGGRHPIGAIFEANRMRPRIKSVHGKKEVAEPIYYAGRSYILPAEDQIEALNEQWQERLKELLR